MCAYNLSWLSSSVQNQGQNLSLLLALLNAMKTLRSDTAAQTPEWFEALSTLQKALDQNQKPASLSQADWITLTAEWSALRTALGNQLPAALRPLGYKLSELLTATIAPATTPGILSYPLVAVNNQLAGATTAGPLSFQTSSQASVQANAVIEVLSSAPEWATAVGYVHPEIESFFRLGLLGNLGVGAGANATPSWGGIGLSASAKASANLDICFNYPPSRYVAQALSDSLQELPAPGDLQGMLAACQGDDFAISSLHVTSTASLNGKLTAGTALVSTLASAGATPSWSPVPLGKSVNINAGISAAFSANWALDGDQHLTVIRDASEDNQRKPVVRLARGSSRSTGASVDISAKIGIEGLQAALDPVMNKILPSAGPLISKLGGLSDLRGLALDALNQQLGLTADDDWTHVAQTLLDIATGGATTKTTQALSSSLSNIISGFTKNYLEQGTVAITSAQNEIEQQIKAYVPGDQVTAGFTTDVTNALQKIAQKINTELTTMAGELNGLAAPLATQVAQSLELATNGLPQFIQGLQNQVNTATARLSTWLKSYEAARERIASAIAKIESNQLALRVAYSYQKKQSTSTLIEVKFLEDTPAARALYKSLWTGQLDDYAAQITKCESEHSASEMQSLFGRTQQRNIGTGLSISVFDFINATSTSSVLDSIKVNTDRNGKIIVAQNAIKLNSKVSVDGSVSETSLSLNLEMLAVKDSPPPLNAEFKASGDSLDQDDVSYFFKLLEAVEAVSPGSGSRVSDFLFDGPAGTKASVAQANISGTQIFDMSAWMRLLQTSPEKLRATVFESCMNCLTVAVASESGYMSGTPADWIAFFLGYTGWQEKEFWSNAEACSSSTMWEDWVLGVTPQSGFDALPVTGPFSSPEYRRSLRRLWEAHRIATFAAQAWVAVGEENTLLAQLPNATPEVAAAAFDRLSKLSSRISKGFAAAFEFNIPDLKHPIKVSWRFLGLVMALHKLALPDDDVAFITKVDTTIAGAASARLFV